MPDSVARFFVLAGGLAGFAGLAALLRSGKEITVRSVLAAMLNSAILGLVVAFIWFTKYSHDLYYLIGLSVLSGIGGVTLVDFLIQLIKRKSWVEIRVQKKDD